MTADNAPGLRPQDFTAQRDQAITEGVKSLFLMNGGAAVALLAFLQAIWATNPYLSKFVIGGIGFHSIGVFLAGCVQLFVYSASFNFQSGRRQRWVIYRRLYLGCAYVSLVAFLSGVAL
jgi:hypothetical protein